jgi:ribonuclease T1
MAAVTRLLAWLALLSLLPVLGAPAAQASQVREASQVAEVAQLAQATQATPKAADRVAAEIAAAELPPEARQTLALIRKGGPYAYRKDGTVFFNRERRLPAQPRGYYTEYTVRTPGAKDRGARRIVAGGDPQRSGEYWYTDDHYRSFKRIRD